MCDFKPCSTSAKKIKTRQELKKIIRTLKGQGKRVVFTNGCFDLLHLGHVKYLEAARKKGDVLIVAVNSDASVRRIKGARRPIIRERDRLRILAALESVDFVLLFKEDTPQETIRVLRPDVLIKGADWSINNIAGKDTVLGYGGKVATIRLLKGRSTTNLINKIAKSF